MKSSDLYYDLLKKSQNKKLEINKRTLLRVKRLYEKSIDDLIKKVDNTKTYNQIWIKGQIEYFENKIKSIDTAVESMIKQGITETSQLMTDVNVDFFSDINDKYNLGIDPNLLESLYRTNEKVINKIIEGGLYKDKLSLSERIWNYSSKNIENVQDILIQGMIEKKPLKEICDELKAYTGGNNSKISTIKRTYGSMNANALRLVRTSLNHAFTETMKDECRYNPFVEGYQWILSGMHSERMKNGDVCDDYANHDEGLGRGVFKKDNVPGQHPNCMCIVVPYVPRDLEDIGQDINDWIHGKENKGIDKWVRSRQ